MRAKKTQKKSKIVSVFRPAVVKGLKFKINIKMLNIKMLNTKVMQLQIVE